jgi:Subtilase family/Secretion system C-terminal sorting domain
MQSVSFTNLMPEPDTYYNSQHISVQNHSYGTGIENFYGADAAAYDASVVNNPVLLHVFSSGNSGTAASSGPYTGITGMANLTGSFKMAKNVLVVGAADSVSNIEALSSKGPAYDGRIKPELVAFGQDGSSGAAAIVSGIALLLQHAYKQQHNDSLPPAALVRAILINTADDAGPKGPDHLSGYGNANAYKAVSAIRQSQFLNSSIQQGNTQTFNLNIPAGLKSLKLTLTWTDQPAQANAAKALVNDLDMELLHVPSGQAWQPWILSRFPHKDSLLLPAVRGRDTVNNIEHITLDAPPAGTYTITVKGSRIINAGQSYFIAYTLDTANRFEWIFPMPADPVTAGASVMVRWNSTFSAGTTGQLQYSLPNGIWKTIANNVDLGANYFRFNTPDTFSTALLRMIISGNEYKTDSFVLSKLLNTQVGFHCSDSFLFYWNRPKGVSSFRVYQRGAKFMEPVAVTSDTFYLGAVTASRQFTVAPLVNNKEGIRAYGFNYTEQGVGCYFRSFLSQLVMNKAELQLQLGSVHKLSRIVLQKRSGNSFRDLQTINNPAALQFDFEDPALEPGVNTYRIALQLSDGRIIYSNTEVVYYLGNTEYIIYPNPVRATASFRILQQEPETIQVLIFDALGRMVKNETHTDVVNAVSTASLQKGVYVVVIEKEGKRVFRGKLIVN